MDIETDALGRFRVALREAFGARLDGVHELDRERLETLVAVVVAGTAAVADDLRAADVAYDVVRATGIAITPNVVSRSVWLSTRQDWFVAVEGHRLSVLRDHFGECTEQGVGVEHSVRVWCRSGHPRSATRARLRGCPNLPATWRNGGGDMR